MSILSPMWFNNITLTCNKKEIFESNHIKRYFACIHLQEFISHLIFDNKSFRSSIRDRCSLVAAYYYAIKVQKKKRETLIVAVFYIDDLTRFPGYHGFCRRADYIIVIAHCCRCMRASHGRGPPNDPEHQRELVQRRRDRGRERKG